MYNENLKTKFANDSEKNILETRKIKMVIHQKPRKPKSKIPLFFRRNFEALSLSEKIIFFSQIATVVFCFVPWAYLSYNIYQPAETFSAFQGYTRFIGILIFLFSFFVLTVFFQKIFEKKIFRLFTTEQRFFLGVSLQNFLLIFCFWSVWISLGSQRIFDAGFGLTLSFFAQILSIIFSYLFLIQSKKSEVQNFFRSPSEKTSNTAKK